MKPLKGLALLSQILTLGYPVLLLASAFILQERIEPLYFVRGFVSYLFWGLLVFPLISIFYILKKD